MYFAKYINQSGAHKLINTNKKYFRDAIKEYSKTKNSLGIFIKEEATYGINQENILPNHFSIWTTSINQNHGSFWNFCDEYYKKHYPEEFI